MMASKPGEVAEVMYEQSTAHPEIADTVMQAARWLLTEYSAPESRVSRLAADALNARFDADPVSESIATWLDGFRRSVEPWQLHQPIPNSL